MKLKHDDAARIPAPDLAVMIELGWVRQWPFEIRPAAWRYIKRNGYDETMRRAAETIKNLGKGEIKIVERPR